MLISINLLQKVVRKRYSYVFFVANYRLYTRTNPFSVRSVLIFFRKALPKGCNRPCVHCTIEQNMPKTHTPDFRQRSEEDMETSKIRVLALDLDGTLTNDRKEVTPRTRAALDAAAEKGVTIVLASGRPTAGISPLAKELGLDKKGGCILSYNGGCIVDCGTGETLYQRQLDAKFIPELCQFAAEQDVAIVTYNKEGVVTERPEDEWAAREGFTCKLPMIKVDDLASYVDYPICKMLITLDPARRDEVCALGQKKFAGQLGLYPSSPFFIEAVPLGVAKDASLSALLDRMGLTRDNLMACGDGLNDRSMISFAGVGVAMQNAEEPVKAMADYVTTADNNHDGVAEAIEKFILN